MKRRTAKTLASLIGLALVILTMVLHDNFPVMFMVVLVGLSILGSLSEGAGTKSGSSEPIFVTEGVSYRF